MTLRTARTYRPRVKSEHGHGHHGRHGNPPDLEAYRARLEGPDRDAWQKPDAVVRALRLRPGATICEVGAGPGYFTLRLARAVGPKGEVFAIDAEPEMIRILRQRVRAARVTNVTPILARRGDALPPRSCRLVLVVDTFHHFPDGPAYLRALAGCLEPGGRIVNVDFHKRKTPVGPPVEHRVARREFLAAARGAGLRLAKEHRFLPYQYFVELEEGAGSSKGSRARSGSRTRSR